MKNLIPIHSFLIKDYVKAFVAILDNLTYKQGKQIWVEKTPSHLYFIDLIRKYIPDAKFIHIIRNGEDVVASLYEVTHRYPEKWGGSRSIKECVERWNTDIKITRQYAKTINHILIRYENLVQEPEFILKKICHFVNIDFTPVMIEQHARMAKLLILHEWKWVNSVKGPIKNMNNTKFVRLFNESERNWIMNHLEEKLD